MIEDVARNSFLVRKTFEDDDDFVLADCTETVRDETPTDAIHATVDCINTNTPVINTLATQLLINMLLDLLTFLLRFVDQFSSKVYSSWLAKLVMLDWFPTRSVHLVKSEVEAVFIGTSVVR